MIYDDPLITYDGAPTDAYFAQLPALVAAQITQVSASEIATAVVADPNTLTVKKYIALGNP